MLKLNARDLLETRRQILEGAFQKDYQTAVEQIESFFNATENLLEENPNISITTDLEYTKTTLVKELTQNGFIVDSTNSLSFTVYLLKDEPAVDFIAPIEDAVEIKTVPIVSAAPYSHGDLAYQARPF